MDFLFGFRDDYSFPIIHPGTVAASEAEPAAIVEIQVDGSGSTAANSANATEPEMNPRKRIYPVDTQRYLQENSDE